MADSQRTSSTPKSGTKPGHYAPPAPARPSRRGAEKPAAKATAATADGPPPRLRAVTITIDADSAEIVRVEGLDATGKRRELSAEEKAGLVTGGHRDELLETVLEHAFEAGIACVLGDDDEQTPQESPADAELRHRLLAPLIERSPVGRLTERAALNRAMLGTLIEHSMQ
jgi:hypothetical protein